MANNEKKLNLADFFYVIRKCWIVECIILAVCIAAGVVIASFTPRYYVASTDVFVDAETGNDVTTGISVARVYIPSICVSAQGDYVLSVASRKTQKKCSSKNITVKNEDNSLIINISYKDSSPEDAKIKLVAIVDALKGFYEAETEEANPLANKKIKITPQYSVISDDGTAQPKITVGSKKKTIVLLSGILGVAAVFIYALCVYFIADKISSSDRLEAISGVKTLGVATNEKIDKKESKNPNRFVRHDLTRVADSLVYDHICTGRQVYQVQSSIAGEGKTSVSINLAIGLAEAHRKTVIIDCDFANPSVHRRVSLHRHTGITDYFQGTKTFDEIVKHTPFEGVDVITCGDRIENHSIFFTSDKFRQLIAQAKEKYEFVILDCAPVRIISDYITVTPLADATVFVARNNYVGARDVESSIKDLERSGATVIGTVLTFADSVADKYYYRYNYAYSARGAEELKNDVKKD